MCRSLIKSLDRVCFPFEVISYTWSQKSLHATDLGLCAFLIPTCVISFHNLPKLGGWAFSFLHYCLTAWEFLFICYNFRWSSRKCGAAFGCYSYARWILSWILLLLTDPYASFPYLYLEFTTYSLGRSTNKRFSLMLCRVYSSGHLNSGLLLFTGIDVHPSSRVLFYAVLNRINLSTPQGFRIAQRWEPRISFLTNG